MLRKRLDPQTAQYPDPVRGINLMVDEVKIAPDEARLMQNFVYDGSVRLINGSGRLNSSVIASDVRGRGGHKYYFGGVFPTGKRLIAYGSNISEIDNSGNETILDSSGAYDVSTYFTTWSITDRVYISNGSDSLRYYDGNTDTFATLTGTNIPVAKAQVATVLDRLLVITADGIERSDARSDTVFSSDSSWATLRPSQVGEMTAIHPYTLKGQDSIFHGAIAFQSSAWYLITGTNYGESVESASPDANEDVAMRLMETHVGTASPRSVLTVPGLGVLWFTTDFNVYLIPEGTLHGVYIADKLRSVLETQGLESVSPNYLDQVWMVYKYPYVMLGIPTAGTTSTNVQFWMDVRAFSQYGPVWSGPHIGQQLGPVWVEEQQADNEIYGLEGDPNQGVWVYQLRRPDTFTNAVGASDNNLVAEYQTFFNPFGDPFVEKYVRSIHYDLKPYSGTALVDLYDIDGLQLEDLTVVEFDEEA